MNVDKMHNARRLSCSQCPDGHYTKGTTSYAKCVVCGHEVNFVDFEIDEPQERIAFADDDGFLYVYDVQYVATINTPGYLPWDDDPPVFDTAREAWDYLLDRRRELEDTAFEMDLQSDGYSATFNTLETLVGGTMAAYENAGLDPIDGTGSIHADDPTYDGDHPLGLVYSVTEVKD